MRFTWPKAWSRESWIVSDRAQARFDGGWVDVQCDARDATRQVGREEEAGAADVIGVQVLGQGGVGLQDCTTA